MYKFLGIDCMENNGNLKTLIEWLPGKSDRESGASWLPTWMHLLDTEGIMHHIADEWLPESIRRELSSGIDIDEFVRICRLSALLHDLGKLTPDFVGKIALNIPGCIENLAEQGLHIQNGNQSSLGHASASAAILLQYDCPISMAVLAASHHGLPPNPSDFNKFKDFDPEVRRGCQGEAESEIWKSIHKKWIDDALKIAGFDSFKEVPHLGKPAQMLITAMLIMADWVASNPSYCPLLPLDERGSIDLYPQRVEDAWAKVSLTLPWDAKCTKMDAERFHKTFGFTPNPIQSAILDAVEMGRGGGIYIIEAPMGCGKTEAALSAAERLDTQTGCGGLFFGLPTMATANGIFERLEPWAVKQSANDDTANSIRLTHSMADLNDLYHDLVQNCRRNALIDDESSAKNDSLIVHEWFSGRKQSLLANFVVGTVDQLLMATLARKHFMLRHLGLAGKVIILDECHAYDTVMNVYLDRMLNWLGKYNTPVIILSATLPAYRREELIKAYLNNNAPESDFDWENSQAYPLLTWTLNGKVMQQVIPLTEPPHDVLIDSINEEKIIPYLRQNLANGGCAGVLVNTVRHAQRLYTELSTEFPPEQGWKIKLFHSGFLGPDRSEREAELMKQIGKHSTPETRDRTIIIGTQVLEQSLDLDFDLMITELCPIDLLLQRIGRLHRHKRVRPQNLQTAHCAVIETGNPQEDRNYKNSIDIYTEYLLTCTKSLLPEKISIPSDISPLVQAVYTKDNGDPKSGAEAEYRNKSNIAMQKGESYCLPEPKPEKREIRDSLLGMGLHHNSGTEMQAEASVRNGDPSIEVLLFGSDGQGNAIILSGKEEGRKIPLAFIPDSKTGRMMASQRVRMPFVFTVPQYFSKTIEFVEKKTMETVSEWQQSPWLHGENILILDSQGTMNILDFTLSYDHEYGLKYEKLTKGDH